MEEVFEAAAEGTIFDLHFIAASGGSAAESVITDAGRCTSLRHVNIVPLTEIAATGDGCFAAFEQAGAGKTAFVTVEKLLADVREQRVPIPPAAALYITREVASAVEYAHGRRDAANRLDPIAHGPLRASAVFLSTVDGGVLLADFGWARVLDQTVGAGEALRGAYFAPESLHAGEWDMPADLFAVGALLYELLALRHVAPGLPHEARAALGSFEPKPASAVRGKLPTVVDDIIMSALAPQIADRPANAVAFQRSLSKALYTAAPFYTGGDLARFLGGLADGSLRAEAAKHKGAKREKKAPRATVSLAGESAKLGPFPIDAAKVETPVPEPVNAAPVMEAVVPTSSTPSTDRLTALGAIEPAQVDERPGFESVVSTSTRDTVVTQRPATGYSRDATDRVESRSLATVEAKSAPSAAAYRFPASDATQGAPPAPVEPKSSSPPFREETPPRAGDDFGEIPQTMSWGRPPPLDSAPRWGSPELQRPPVVASEEAQAQQSFAQSLGSASSPSGSPSSGAFEPTSPSGFSGAAVGSDTDEFTLPKSNRKPAFIALAVAVAAGGGFAVWQLVEADKKPPAPPVARADGAGDGQRADARAARRDDVRAANGDTARAGDARAAGGVDGGAMARVDGTPRATASDAREARAQRPTDGEARREVVARATAVDARRETAGRERREARADAARRRATVTRVAREAREVIGGGGTGYLTVKSDRWAYVYVDGGKKRQTPLTRLPLKVGAHTVKLHDPNEDLYKEFSVTITAGQTTVKSVYW